MKNIAISVASLAVVFGLRGISEANRYSVVAGGCEVVSQSVGAAKNSFGHGMFVNGTGTVRMICPVTNFDSSTWSNYVTYHNNNDNTHTVTVALKTATIGSSSATTIQTCTSTLGFSSQICHLSPFVPSSSNWYWFDITITRPTLAKDIEWLGLTIN